MVENKEISALFNLMDDPDEEVFSSVTNRLISLGRAVIPNLENLWESSPDQVVQSRVEMIIHELNFRDLKKELSNWKTQNGTLLQGALLLSKYGNPDVEFRSVYQEIERLRRNIWLELNSYLTPLEQVNVISGILFSYFNLKGSEINYENPSEFNFQITVEDKKGNPITNGILYLVICEMLDIPVRAISIPQQFILGYFSGQDVHSFLMQEDDEDTSGNGKIIFYIDPINGQVYSQKDVENYLNRIGINAETNYFAPLNAAKILQHLILEWAKCFEKPDDSEKKKEIQSLAALLED